MNQKLSPVYSFNAAPHKERLRLIVFQNNEEFVCRKENIKKMAEFLSGESKKLFKGRLQLMKKKDSISIQVKGETIGEISETDFRELLRGF